MDIRHCEYHSRIDKKLVSQAIKDVLPSDIVEEPKVKRYSTEATTYVQARTIQDLGEGVIDTSIGRIYAMVDNENKKLNF